MSGPSTTALGCGFGAWFGSGWTDGLADYLPDGFAAWNESASDHRRTIGGWVALWGRRFYRERRFSHATLEDNHAAHEQETFLGPASD